MTVDGAACRGLNAEVFFPDKGGDFRQAQQVCADCPVLRVCLEGAFERDEEFGIWGGAGESTRRWLRRVWADRGRDRQRWERVLAEHVARLRGDAEPGLQNRNGDGATHGAPSTYARGCRCAPCVFGAAIRTHRDSRAVS